MGRSRKQLHWQHPDDGAGAKQSHATGHCFCKSRKRYEGQKAAKPAPRVYKG